MAAFPNGKEERKVHMGSQAGLALGAEPPRGGPRTDQATGLMAKDQLITWLQEFSSFYKELAYILNVLLLKTI